MFYVNRLAKSYQEEFEEGLIEVDDDFENASNYSITTEGEVVEAWSHNGISYSLFLKGSR
jgi:hypothetical protein